MKQNNWSITGNRRTLVLGILGLALVTAIPPLFEGNLVVDSYDAVLYENGTLTEHYTYDVKASRQVPHAVPVVGGPPHPWHPSPSPSVADLFRQSPPSGNRWHMPKMVPRRVMWLPSAIPPRAVPRKQQSANLAESKRSQGYSDPSITIQGKYTVGYTYLLHPPIEYDTAATRTLT